MQKHIRKCFLYILVVYFINISNSHSAFMDIRNDKSDSRTYLVTLATIPNNSSDSLLGHAMVAWTLLDYENKLNIQNVFGYYPNGFDYKTWSIPGQLINEILNGKYKDATLFLHLRVDAEIFYLTDRIRQKWLEKGSNYALRKRDCITFMTEVAAELGIVVPERVFPTFPDEFLLGIIDQYANPLVYKNICFNYLLLNYPIKHAWSDNCLSEYFFAYYDVLLPSAYYAFHLSNTQEVTIDLTSSSDTLLFLWRYDENFSGFYDDDFAFVDEPLYENDDFNGTTNSRINQTLPKGRYIIEATTFNPESTESFKLSVRTSLAIPEDTYYTLWVSKTGTGTGTVQSQPGGINCGNDCNENYISNNYVGGLSVALYATPSENSRFVGWSGGGCSGVGTCVITGHANTISVNAHFDIKDSAYDNGCVSTLPINASVSGSWNTSCSSASHYLAHAKYYTFTIDRRQVVTVNLDSSVLSRLYLLKGAGSSGDLIGSNIKVRTDSQLVWTLDPGTYTIEATPHFAGFLGDFIISLETDDFIPTLHGCEQSISIGQSLNGIWDGGCDSSEYGRFGKTYRLVVPTGKNVRLKLTSQKTQTHLLLFDDDDKLIADNEQNDNYVSYSFINRYLTAGVYIIEATTVLPDDTGRYVLSVE